MRPFPALLTAVRADLRSFIGGESVKLCEVRVDGQPPPAAGQWFYAIHPGRISGDTSQTTHLDQTYSFAVTITRKSGGGPNDRQGQALLLDSDMLLDRVDAVIDRVHGRGEIIALANGYIPGTAGTGFYEPPRFQSAERVEFCEPDWFFAGGSESDVHVAGLRVTINFGEARYTKDKR